MASVDLTFLVDKGMPKTWKCPHCGKRQKSGFYAESILMEHFKYVEHCTSCGHLHFWKLKLTDEFKQKTVDMLLSGTS